MKTWILAIGLETVGICAVLTGVGIEVYYEADIGFIVITSGAAIAMFGSMVYAKIINR